MGRYTFEISSDPVWWTINSVDKPNTINLTFTPITLQNVNWVDSFNISFIADKNTYTYLRINDTTTDEPAHYYYLETTSKRLTQGFECKGKLDVWATFLNGLGGQKTRFTSTYDYPIYVDRFLNTNKTCLETYYNSVSYLQKDEFFDYSHFPLTSNPNKYEAGEASNTTNTNFFADTMFNDFGLYIYNYGTFQTSAGGNDARSFVFYTFKRVPNTNTNIRKYYGGVPYLLVNSNKQPVRPDIIGILFQPSTDDSVYRLVLCANKEDQYLLLNCNAHYSSSTNYDPNYGGKLIYSKVMTSGYAAIKFDKFDVALKAIMNNANGYVNGGATNDNAGYWRDKIIGVFKMDFLELLSLDGFRFTTLASYGSYDNVVNPISSYNTNQFSGTLPSYGGILFKDFSTREWLKVTNQIKWRWTTYNVNNVYWTWLGRYYNQYTNIDSGFSADPISYSVRETYKRIDTNNYLLRYPLSRISIDNYCMNPFFGRWIYTGTTTTDFQKNNNAYGWLDSPLSAITFDGNKWVLVSPHNDSFIYSTDFTQASYTIATDGYKSYLNSVKSQQDATLRVAQANSIFKGISSTLFGGGLAALNLFTGNIPAAGKNIAEAAMGPVEAGLDYYAQEQQIEAQRQDMRRSASAHVIQAGNTQATALNIARQLMDSDKSFGSVNGSGWMVHAPLSLSDIRYYNSLVWKMGIKAGFNINLGYVVCNYRGSLTGPSGSTTLEYQPRYDNNFNYFQIKDIPEPLIRKWYPNLQNDYIQAIKALFAGGVRLWKRNLTGNNDTDGFVMRWDLEES